MANFTGYTPQTLPRFGSIVQSDDTTQQPLGIAKVGRNVRYREQSVATRFGTSLLLNFGGPIGGLGALRYLAPNNSGQSNISIIAATQNDGNVWIASPFTQSSVTQLTTDSFLAQSNIQRQPGLFYQCCQAFNRMYIAQTDLLMGVAPALLVDGSTQNIDPISDIPFGETWTPSQNYRVGQVVTAINQSGPAQSALFRCIQPGESGLDEPVWPPIEGQTVGDNGIIWEKITIVVSSGLTPPPTPILQGVAPDSGSAVVDGMTIFLVCSWTNQFGESIAQVANPDGSLGNVLQYKNTTGAPVDVNVVLPAVPPDLVSLPAQYAVTGCNLYAYFVTGQPDQEDFIDSSFYALLGSFQPNAAVSVKAFATGANPPSDNTAFTTDAGNVSSGTRYMIVLYETRTGYITGVSDPVPIRCDISLDGRKMLAQNIPIGPYNCVARICAFTVAGQSSAGPYFYISADDFVDPGEGAAKILQTATKINDNQTTSTFFDFIDSYLEGASEVTDYFDRIQVPPASDIYFSKGLNRVIYTGCQGFPSTYLVTDLQDPEAVRIPGSNLDVATEDGDRCICWREMRGVQISCKENSGHAITPNDGDPNTWAADELWSGMGPCGPRAIDIYAADLSIGQQGQPFLVFAHRTGGFLYTSGAPMLITREMQTIWETINWECAPQIKVGIDPKHREIRFHVPTGASTTNNLTLTLNYYFGFGEPVIFSVRSGKMVANPEGRKWSVDDISANDACYIPQRFAYTPPVLPPTLQAAVKPAAKVHAFSSLASLPPGGEGSSEPPPPPPVSNPLSITTLSMPAATLGLAYDQGVSASGGKPPYTFSIIAGALPAGLSMDPATGVVTGTPTASGTSSFTVRVVDTSVPQKVATATLSIAIPATPSITTSSLPQAIVDVPYFASITAAGGAAPYGFQISAGSLPSGLDLATTGGITGTPTVSGNFNVTIQVFDSNNPQGTNTASFTLVCVAGSIANPVVALNETLLLAGADGGLYCISDFQYHDQDLSGTPKGIFAKWVSVTGQNPKLTVMQLGGATVAGKGNGLLNVAALDTLGRFFNMTTATRMFTFSTDVDEDGNLVETIKDIPARAIPKCERYGISLDNGGVVDSWFEIHIATLYIRPFFAARRG